MGVTVNSNQMAAVFSRNRKVVIVTLTHKSHAAMLSIAAKTVNLSRKLLAFPFNFRYFTDLLWRLIWVNGSLRRHRFVLLDDVVVDDYFRIMYQKRSRFSK